MSNNLVSYSRAGDVFHYRWAARRCLKLIYPNSDLKKIYIEGSSESKKAGEYVIDVSEYSKNSNGEQLIDYYQLKHTTVNEDDPFTLSDLKGTIEGFSKRYKQHRNEHKSIVSKVTFTIITNRKIANSFKDNLSAILAGKTVDNVFLRTIKKYTKLSSQNLISFCSLLNLEDGEGNYNVQKDELRLEMTRISAGSVDNTEVNNLVALVQEKVMPDSDGSISREEVLKRFGVTSERDLYPAPAIWEVSEKIIERTQHSLLQDKIVESQYPVIIHAAGGVGKSVFCRQLINSLPENNFGIAYDCFGAGSYRNRSETRHGHRVALVQIANELASKGLCNPLLVRDTTLDEDIMRQFISRIDTSVKSLKEVDSSAMLFILVDAADNAEMAAKEYTQSCFAHELLREKIPQDCKLVLLCRTERIDHLQPESYVLQIELEGFSKEETLTNLQRSFPNAGEDDGIEFHRLTSANPRVQSNALDAKHTKIVDLLSSLGPSGTTVQDQIAMQLSSAISKIKDQLPKLHHEQINSICTGLASLPPHIPIDVLSAVTGVSIEHVKSFVSDIGRSLWLSDNTVQFRDEPTETWFRETFVPTEKSCEDYIKLLEPIASKRPYIAEVLPQLYLQAGQYQKLIQIALSDDYLPEDNPIDARNIRVYRLQFAFKAALRLSKFDDAIKLAMRAGEESAGNERQLELFMNNTDLLPILQSKEKVQEIAFKRLLDSGWDGSENIYAASLLSGIKDYHGEARGYLRAALNWLVMYYNDNTTTKRRRRGNDDVSMNDVLNLSHAQLNILGVKDCVDNLKRFTSKRWIFPIVQALTRRLIDIEDFKTIDDFLKACKNEVYFIVAVTSELIKVARFPDASILTSGLQLLCSSKKRIEIPSNDFQDPIVPGIISFLEACIYRELDGKKILNVINYYTPEKAYRMVYQSHFSEHRTKFLKALAIKVLLNGEQTFDIEKISPEEFQVKTKNYAHNDEIQKLREFVSCLFPWYFLRVQILFDKNISLFDAIDDIDSRSSKATSYRYSFNNTLPDELAQIRASIIILYSKATKEEVDLFFNRFLFKDKNFRIHSKIETLRSSYRLQHLEVICQKLENHVYELIQSYRDDSPDELSDKYIALARAVLTNSTEDASIYFDDAINIVSKFGDEIVERWRAIVSIAEKSCGCSETSDELTYRFIRCAELVGENVDREKYWDRGKATQLCIRMSTGVGVSALSRWRDRDIGRYKYQFADALNELVMSKLISPSVGWSLTPFCDLSHIEFLSLCIENESSTEIQQQILQDAVYLTQLEGSSAGYWDQLKSIAVQHNLKNPTLDSIVQPHQIDENEDEKPDIAFNSEASIENWDVIFEGIEITTMDGFTSLLDRFKIGKQEDDFEWRLRDLLDESVTRIDLKNIWSFIEILFLFDDFSRYDIANIISSLPESFKKKVSFRSNLEKMVHRFGERFAHEFMGDSLQYFVEYLNLDEMLTTKLKSGMLQGLAAGEEFAQSNVFFGFVGLAVTEIERNNAVDLLDFSLGRFELHIDTEFGDEEWSDKLMVTDDVDTNIAGYLWSAIGSPRSEVRWNTAHCVRKLVEFNCQSTIDALMGWLKFGGVGAFGASKFPFYDLHAKQYLLMALQSASSTNPDMLRKHQDLFIDFALSTKHILIQKFAAGIILNIENKFQGTYSKADIDRVKEIGVSQFTIEKKDYNYSTNSYWHDANKIDLTLDTKVGFDMGDYWYKPLGEVFGVPQKQIEQLAADVVFNKWKMNRESGFNNDPRDSLWNSSSGDRDTYYYKDSYPSVDNLDFYIEYHAMLSVASKLLETMPIVRTNEWIEEPWKYWLSHHMLSYENGIWLSDCRDPLPKNRPSWIKTEKKDTWKVELQTEDFLQYLINKEKEDTWISIRGASHEKQDNRKEVFYVRTALVSKNTSDALLNALSTCSDPMDYKLPDIDDDWAEIESGIFQLKGWTSEASISKGIEELDPHAFGIEPSSFIIDENILNRFNLISDDANKIWMEKDSQKRVLTSKTWSSSWKGKDEEVDQSGVILTADLSFLKNLCYDLDCELIFDVSLKRDTYHRYSKEENEYAKPQHKLFILSADGKLRSSYENYQLG